MGAAVRRTRTLRHAGHAGWHTCRESTISSGSGWALVSEVEAVFHQLCGAPRSEFIRRDGVGFAVRVGPRGQHPRRHLQVLGVALHREGSVCQL